MFLKGLNFNKKTTIIISCVLAGIIVLTVIGFCVFKGKSTKTKKDESSSVESDVESDIVEIEDIVEPEIQTELKKEEKEQTAKLKKQSDEITLTKENEVVVKETEINYSNITQRAVRLNVNFLAQNPELPTGCEITSLTTVLNYFEYSVTKLEMSSNYLAKEAAPADWTSVFVGDPTDAHSFGCYAQPITDAANKYFADNGSKHIASNASGCDFSVVLEEVQRGYPVVLWGTSNLSKPYKTIKWMANGKEMQWIAPEHCYVLIGYDLDRNIAVISDPQKGIMEYDLLTVRDRYEALNRQCVFIEENPYYVEETPNNNEETHLENNNEVLEDKEKTEQEEQQTEEETSLNEDENIKEIKDESLKDENPPKDEE